MSFIDHFNKLHEHIKGYTFFGFSIKSNMGNGSEVIGWNCHASSVTRKDETLKRVNECIEKLCLPLMVQEENDKTKYFKILNK